MRRDTILSAANVRELTSFFSKSLHVASFSHSANPTVRNRPSLLSCPITTDHESKNKIRKTKRVRRKRKGKTLYDCHVMVAMAAWNDQRLLAKLTSGFSNTTFRKNRVGIRSLPHPCLFDLREHQKDWAWHPCGPPQLLFFACCLAHAASETKEYVRPLIYWPSVRYATSWRFASRG